MKKKILLLSLLLITVFLIYKVILLNKYNMEYTNINNENIFKNKIVINNNLLDEEDILDLNGMRIKNYF